MGSEAWFVTKVIGVCVLALVALGVFCTYADKSQCYAKWGGSGMRIDWGAWKGCQLEVAPGKWIPEDRYREVP